MYRASGGKSRPCDRAGTTHQSWAMSSRTSQNRIETSAVISPAFQMRVLSLYADNGGSYSCAILVTELMFAGRMSTISTYTATWPNATGRSVQISRRRRWYQKCDYEGFIRKACSIAPG